MHEGRFIFSQLMAFLPAYEFNKCVRRYHGNYQMRMLSCYDQFLCMAFGQLTYRDSLRDVVTCLDVLEKKLFHVGIRAKVSRSTLVTPSNPRSNRKTRAPNATVFCITAATAPNGFIIWVIGNGTVRTLS